MTYCMPATLRSDPGAFPIAVSAADVSAPKTPARGDRPEPQGLSAS
ncbi:MAG: hypothetical protein KDD88_03975 [Rhodobacteraceae bacterium]|nr:hypothetical protein [Paracoccaceae bacterium]